MAENQKTDIRSELLCLGSRILALRVTLFHGLSEIQVEQLRCLENST